MKYKFNYIQLRSKNTKYILKEWNTFERIVNIFGKNDFFWKILDLFIRLELVQTQMKTASCIGIICSIDDARVKGVKYRKLRQ